MRKVFIYGISGVVTLYLGILAWYLFLVSLNEQPNYYTLTGAVLLINTSAFLFYKATNIKNAYSSSDTPTPPVSSDSPTLQNTLVRNNEIVNEWQKTSNRRDKLKLLEATEAFKKR